MPASTVPMSALSSDRTLATSVRPSAISALSVVSTQSTSAFEFCDVSFQCGLGGGDVGRGGDVASDGVADGPHEGFGQRFRGSGFAESLHGAVGVEGERYHGDHCRVGHTGSLTAAGSGAMWCEIAVGRSSSLSDPHRAPPHSACTEFPLKVVEPAMP